MTTNELDYASADLETLETIIRDGLDTFVKVGNALMTIRDRRLYKEQGYTSFEGYCSDRWGISRSRGYQLIESAEAVSTIVDTIPDLPPPQNEAQARALARTSADERAEVWQQANETTNGKPTAKAVKDAATPTHHTPRRTKGQKAADDFSVYLGGLKGALKGLEVLPNVDDIDPETAAGLLTQITELATRLKHQRERLKGIHDHNKKAI